MARGPCAPLKKIVKERPEVTVINCIIKANRHLLQALEVMHQNPKIFPRHWVRFMARWRESIGAYGGSLVQRMRWEKDE